MPLHGADAADAGWSKPLPFSAEQPMALLAAAGGHQTTPMSLHGVAAADAGSSKPWSSTSEQLLAQRAAAGGHQATPMPLHRVDAADAGWSTPLPFSAKQPMAPRSAAGDHQATPMPLHGAAAVADAGRCKPCLLSAQKLMSLQNAEFDEHKLPDSNKAVPPSKTSLAEKSELTGITIPVKKLKPPKKWNCTVCQVQATCEKNLQMHYAGQKHLANVATLGPGTKPSDQKAKAGAAEPSLGTEQRKTSSINWSCSTCQARGTSKSTFDAHLQGKRHQQNIAEASVKGDGAPKNAAVAGEAKSDGITVPKPSEKPSRVWSCGICQTTCTCETDLKNHLKGARHREKVQSLLEESKNVTRNPETNLKKNNAPQMVKNQGPHPAWNCTMCQAKCFSKSQFESHCSGSRHQQNIEAILGKRETAKVSSSRTANEPASDGSSGKNASSKKAEKKEMLYFCEVCNLLCGSSEMLVSHRYGKRHREKLSAGK
ncbi:UBP1-associated proteins 1C-like [Triticum dicoccoides]|uniref:UBP1-associated proteins 1C-like n=1 Tax=Triticum dicoccoides TaxID=85692 RepID=UPI00188E2FB3|nr:UBP1-associated proteins 1C-like [Triticum dicoccoides]